MRDQKARMLECARHLCPYLDRRDGRCADLHTLVNLREAFRLCAGDHEACPTYHQIRLSDLYVGRARRLAQPA